MIEFRRLTRQRLKRMLAAGEDVLSCQRALEKGGLNIVGEVLRGQGTFYEWTHYPEGDVFDRDSHAQYYYHAHRSAPDEHGHFHLFLRKAGMPDGIGPAPHAGSAQDWPTGEGQLSHLVAVAMDSHGWPIRLFCTNRWVTGETWYRAEDVVRMLDRFVVDHAYPSWPVNRWLTAIVQLYHPQISQLLLERDRRIADHAARNPDLDPLEDRRLEVTGAFDIAVEQQIARVRAALRTDALA